MILGNQLGNTLMVRGLKARQWVVVAGCSCGVGVCVVEAVSGQGFSRVGVYQHQDVAAFGATQQWGFLNTMWQLVG